MAKLVDARDLKSLVLWTCRFDPGSGHHFKSKAYVLSVRRPLLFLHRDYVVSPELPSGRDSSIMSARCGILPERIVGSPLSGLHMTPNAELYNPSTEYADKLISRIGQTPSWIAKRIGVTDKRIRYILEGERTVKGETTPIQMTYTEQFALECLAAEVANKKK